MLVNQHMLISIEMVFVYHFLELFIGKCFKYINNNSTFTNNLFGIIYNTQSYDKIQWTTAYILQTFNVPESYKNKSLLKRMQNSRNKSHIYLIILCININFNI